jgi:NNP family nitrate/nitrite transporter-like MFS transporter
VTFGNFIAMAIGVLAVLQFLPANGAGGNFIGFLAAFLLLFATAGIGNGSTFRMIPIIFLTERQRAVARDYTKDQAVKDANKEAAAVLGFSSAVGAYGGFFIPKSYGTSIAITGGPEAALYCFIVFYLTCIAVTWWFYSRRNAPMPC